jgi:hypothetical protein
MATFIWLSAAREPGGGAWPTRYLPVSSPDRHPDQQALGAQPHRGHQQIFAAPDERGRRYCPDGREPARLSLVTEHDYRSLVRLAAFLARDRATSERIVAEVLRDCAPDADLATVRRGVVSRSRAWLRRDP